MYPQSDYKAARILSQKTLRTSTFINIALYVCIAAGTLIYLYIYVFSRVMLAGAQYVDGLVFYLPVWYPLLAFGIVGILVGIMSIISLVAELVRKRRLNVKRVVLTAVLALGLFFPGQMPAYASYVYFSQYISGLYKSAQYKIAGGPSEADLKEANVNYADYAVVKAEIDKCNVISVKYYEINYAGDPNDEKNLYIHVSLYEEESRKENGRYVRGYSLPFTDHDRLLQDMKHMKATCPEQEYGPYMQPWPRSTETRDEYGNPTGNAI